MKIIEKLFPFKQRAKVAQTSKIPNSILGNWLDYSPITPPDAELYCSMRAAVPVIDAALDKIIRLTGGFSVIAENQLWQSRLDDFVANVRVGAAGIGLRQFIATYLDSLLSFGNAVGEIIPTTDESGVYALYNAKLKDVKIKQGDNPFCVEIGTIDSNLRFVPVLRPEYVLFTPLNPPAGEALGVPLLRSLPFVSSILMKIFESVGNNFDRIANLRYAVTYKPSSGSLDNSHAKDIADSIAEQWSEAMSSQSSGVIKDFVAVGDVDIKVIGADNQTIDTEIPVRHMMEQIVAKLGVPPFMLGLHWSSTERMSTQQADILTSELSSYRSLLEPVILQICGTHLRMLGSGSKVKVEWSDNRVSQRDYSRFLL